MKWIKEQPWKFEAGAYRVELLADRPAAKV